MKNVLMAAPVSEAFRNYLKQKGYLLLEEWDDSVQGIVTSNKLILPKEKLQSLHQLQWIARLGSGMEIIDTQYCKEKGIACFSSPKGIANAVAEHVSGMLLALLHHIPRAMEEIKQKAWIREANRGQELASFCVGIIGYGHTGSAFAKKMAAFTSSILVYDKYKTDTGDSFVRFVSLEELQSRAQVISFHVPLNEETLHYYNDDFLAACGSHILLNASRGAVCSTQTILNGLALGQITGACLDVLEEEKNINEILHTPQNTIAQLLQYPVIITPHIAGYSVQAIEKMSDELMEQLKTIL
jgi:D-3-phosphoglycerate dehydrogenase